MTRSFLFLLLFLSFLQVSYAVFPKEISKKVEKEKQEKIAEKLNQGEKSLYLHLHITRESIKDIFRFVVKIRNKSDRVSAFINNSLSKKTHTLMMNYNEMGEPSPILVRLLLIDINRLIVGALIYDQEIFSEVKLGQETDSLLKKGKAEGETLVRLNRMLLEDAYPEEIVPLKRDMSGFFAKAKPIVVEVSTAEYNQRFLDLYAGKTFNAPLMPQKEGEEEKKAPPKKPQTQPKEEKSGVWFWVVGVTGVAALFWTLKQFGSHTS